MGPTKPGETRLDKHRVAFEACAVTLQCQLENGHPLFTVQFLNLILIVSIIRPRFVDSRSFDQRKNQCRR